MKIVQASKDAQIAFLDDCLWLGPFRTYGQIADAAELQQSAVYRAAKGEQSLNIHSLGRIAEACGLVLILRAIEKSK